MRKVSGNFKNQKKKGGKASGFGRTHRARAHCRGGREKKREEERRRLLRARIAIRSSQKWTTSANWLLVEKGGGGAKRHSAAVRAMKLDVERGRERGRDIN